ncbi:MAG: MFS transporter [Gammaproteobacteria bacterium]|jgi:BCD family chlorophyll transporter-like MFS transporter|nr:MFS transporter [Gammaproteobacteria bacterium]
MGGLDMKPFKLRYDSRFLPFADAASDDLPLLRLLRLSLFQVSVGIALALLNGTLNRVMIVELGVPAWLVATMVALPLLFAPMRAFMGFHSDQHRSVLGWRRVPYIWFGTLLQYGGLAIMPFALLVLSGEGRGPAEVGQVGAAIAFLLVGAGLHSTQTAGLALATDLAPDGTRPRVVALMYVMLLLGMVGSSLAFGWLLSGTFSPLRLIQTIQGAAVITLLLNILALWKQEPRNLARLEEPKTDTRFATAWRSFTAPTRTRRLLATVGFGTAAFSMQDVLLEPYGGQILNMGVGATSQLTALSAGGALIAFGLAARALKRGADPLRVAAVGALFGVIAFAAVVFAEPLGSALLFRSGALLIGFGGGLFSVGTLLAAMALHESDNGLALGAWGAVQATAAGLSIALGGAACNLIGDMAVRGQMGPALESPATGYLFVYHFEIALLFAALIAVGPLTRRSSSGARSAHDGRLGLAELPG